MTLEKNYYLSTILLLVFFSACSNDDDYTKISLDSELVESINLVASMNALKLPNGDLLSEFPNDPKNIITAQKVALGKLLFHETGLALNPKKQEGMGTYSCASCHHFKAGFQSGIKQGIGEGGVGFGLKGETRHISVSYDATTVDVQPLRSPTILNSAYQDVMLWNGQFGATKTNTGTESQWTEGTPKEKNLLGFEGLETQAIAGLGVHRLNIEPKMIQENETYKGLFDAAFPNIPVTERYTLNNGGLAIAAYERTVVASESPFQQWLNGNTESLNDDEKKGAILFFGKAKCYSCHSGPGLNGMDFHALGMNDFKEGEFIGQVQDNDRKGRGGFTKNAEDDYKFKTPTLYNLKGLNFLGHGGSFSSVQDIIIYKNEAIAENSFVPSNKLSSQFKPLKLSSQEINQLTVFIENGLYDNNLERFVPKTLPTGNCFPNSDSQSQIDMGCN